MNDNQAPETINTLEEISFLLQEDPEVVDTFAPRDIIHAIDPGMNRWRKALPVGTTLADMWIVRHGDPLKNLTAALTLIKQTVNGSRVTVDTLDDVSRVSIYFGSTDMVTATAEHPEAAAVAALVNYVMEFEQ
jgi:hypothetical protein